MSLFLKMLSLNALMETPYAAFLSCKMMAALMLLKFCQWRKTVSYLFSLYAGLMKQKCFNLICSKTLLSLKECFHLIFNLLNIRASGRRNTAAASEPVLLFSCRPLAILMMSFVTVCGSPARVMQRWSSFCRGQGRNHWGTEIEQRSPLVKGKASSFKKGKQTQMWRNRERLLVGH